MDNEGVCADSPSVESTELVNYCDPNNYVQIGCRFYFVDLAPDALGHLIPTLVPWQRWQLSQDFKGHSDDLKKIQRFTGLGSYPSHLNYQQRVRDHYNTYCPMNWQPSCGDWSNIKMMLQHIFGDQYELGLDYIQLLYMRPKQMLPILVLVSRERQTGKTTFLNFLKAVFGANVAFVTNDTMRSKFNSERAGRLIIACDEAFLNKKEDSERLKALSTAQKTYIEFKGKDRYEIDNFSKIIMCSNNIIDPVYIDEEEVRYWVRDVPKPPKDYPGLSNAMKKEIPAFLDALLNRQLCVPFALSRMWFDAKQLRTAALERIVRSCRPTCEIELAEILLEEMDRYNVQQLQYTTNDLNTLLKARGHSIPDAHRIICKQWRIPHATNKMSYKLYAPWVEKPPIQQLGRYYTFTQDFLETLVPN